MSNLRDVAKAVVDGFEVMDAQGPEFFATIKSLRSALSESADVTLCDVLLAEKAQKYAEQVERMSPVVEAAVAFERATRVGDLARRNFGIEAEGAATAICAAVRAYESEGGE